LRSRTLAGSRILLLGLAYKKNVSDVRESPALKLMELLEKKAARVEFHDPHVREIPPTREYSSYAGRRSVFLTVDMIADYDAVLIVTDHDAVDYSILANATLVVDTRNACTRRGLRFANLVKA
jgi:UDP-N-acetyl-D-glucosamine dehydrogenase